MKDGFRRVCCLLLIGGLAAGFFGTAQAADTFSTSGRVNFRAGASLDARVIKTLDSGVSVEVLDYDAENWSQVKIDGVTGYIKSEYLIVSGQEETSAGAITYHTTGRVNFRTGPSTGADVIKLLNTGVSVEVLAYDPDNWSKVSVNGTVGYIKSEYLVQPAQAAQPVQATASTSGDAANTAGGDADAAAAAAAYRTTGRVNFRAGPSTDADIIRLLNAGVAVEMIEYDPDHWSKVAVNGETGYIKSEFLANGDSYAVELLEWSIVKGILKLYVPIQIIDVRTGLAYHVQSFSNGEHADVEPLTKNDTDTLKKTYGGVWSWAPRPVWVTMGGRTIAASINGMPHGGGTIANNGMSGQVCLHFLGSKTHNGNNTFQQSHQDGVMEAWNAR